MPDYAHVAGNNGRLATLGGLAGAISTLYRPRGSRPVEYSGEFWSGAADATCTRHDSNPARFLRTFALSHCRSELRCCGKDETAICGFVSAIPRNVLWAKFIPNPAPFPLGPSLKDRLSWVHSRSGVSPCAEKKKTWIPAQEQWLKHSGRNALTRGSHGGTEVPPTQILCQTGQAEMGK